MKLKLLALLSALLLVLGASACSSDDSSSEDTTTTEEADDETTTTEDEEEEDEEESDGDAAEAALEKIERNFGLSKKDPEDDEDTDDTTDSDGTDLTSGLTSDEQECVVETFEDDEDLLAIAEDIESASPDDQSLVLQVFYSCLSPESQELVLASFTESFGVDVTADEADCILSLMISDPDAVSMIFSGVEPDPSQLGSVVDIIFGCLGPESLTTFLETSFADSGLTPEQTTCLAEALAADPVLLNTIVSLGIDPTTTPDQASIEGLTALFAGCGVDPATL